MSSISYDTLANGDLVRIRMGWNANQSEAYIKASLLSEDISEEIPFLHAWKEVTVDDTLDIIKRVY